MKNKGYTLVELLAVLVILSIIVVLVFPTVNNVLFQSKDTVYQTQINKILNASYDFSLKNMEYLPEYNKSAYITLGELKYNGLIPFDLTNPDTNNYFEDNLVISIKNVGTNYKTTNENSKTKGDYLYTVEINKTENKDLLPKINLENLPQNSDGDYLVTLDLNENLENITYTAISHDDIDLTDKVRKYIVSDDQVVDRIDSSKSSVYTINYSVIDDNGYANLSKLHIIIADIKSPEITLPTNNKINKDMIIFDLLNGVICEDNSGFCEIETSGEIDFGVIGKYIITYTAKDPSGNTSTKKRVITIE